MDWLKKGMKVKIKYEEKVETILKIEDEPRKYFIDSIVYLEEHNIDWKETAELNGIDLKEELWNTQVGDIIDIPREELEEILYSKDSKTKKFSPKYDENKLDWSLLPISEIEEIVKVLDYGKHKYEKNGWQNVEDAKNRYLSATYRHLVEYTKGNKIDEESGLSHLSHLATNIIFLMWFENNEVE